MPSASPPQRHDVERESGEVHQGERSHDGDGDRDGYVRGAAQVAQKEEEDEQGERSPEERRHADVGYRPPDVLGGVPYGRQVDLRDVPVDSFHFFEHAFCDRHGVRARLLVDRQPHAGPAVDADDSGDLPPRVGYLGDFPQPDGHALADGDGRVPDLIDAPE